MNPRVIYALVLRYIYLYSRTFIRVAELVFWPLVELILWGFLTVYLQQNGEGDFVKSISFLIGGMILWDVLFRAQQGVAISFLEDIWTRNLLNIFVAPVRATEYVSAFFVVGFLRICVTVSVLTVFAWLLYAFNLFELKGALIPLFANLLLFGWSLGIISTTLIMRWGQAAEGLAWAVPFFIQPLICVFYPVSVMPEWLQPVALAIPCTHVFEGMRDVLNPEITGFPWHHMIWATILNVVFMALTAVGFWMMLEFAKKRGLLTKIAVH